MKILSDIKQQSHRRVGAKCSVTASTFREVHKSCPAWLACLENSRADEFVREVSENLSHKSGLQTYDLNIEKVPTFSNYNETLLETLNLEHFSRIFTFMNFIEFYFMNFDRILLYDVWGKEEFLKNLLFASQKWGKFLKVRTRPSLFTCRLSTFIWVKKFLRRKRSQLWKSL